jgi:hypothetical protein
VTGFLVSMVLGWGLYWVVISAFIFLMAKWKPGFFFVESWRAALIFGLVVTGLLVARTEILAMFYPQVLKSLSEEPSSRFAVNGAMLAVLMAILGSSLAAPKTRVVITLRGSLAGAVILSAILLLTDYVIWPRLLSAVNT